VTVRRPLIALALVVACLGIAATAAAATSGGAPGYQVRGCSYEPSRGAIAAAPEGGVVFRLCGKSGATSLAIARITPDGKLVRLSAPRSSGGPNAVGPQGEIWTVGESGGRHLGLHRIGPGGSVGTFSLGTAKRFSSLRAYGLVPDGAGAVWVALGEPAPDYYGRPNNSTGGALVHVAADGTVDRFRVPGEIEPQGLVRGPDGNLWFTGVSGRGFSEHGGSLGTGYVGRMTPTGEFALFRTSTEEAAPAAIAAGLDGSLWFLQATARETTVGTISTDGTLGPRLDLHAGSTPGDLTVGPEGDAWLATESGLVRVTPSNQETVFRQEGTGVVTGAEGDIWTVGPRAVRRVVPGAPGLDVWQIEADPRTEALHVQLACGGSEEACEGTVDLSFSRASRKGASVPIGQVPYSVPAGSQGEVTLGVPSRIFALARSEHPRGGSTYGPRFIVHATVAGGPDMERRALVSTLVAAPGSLVRQEVGSAR